MSLLATVNARGLLSARPAAASANEGYLYFATDSPGTLYRSNGTSWDVNSPTGLADQGTATFLDFTTAAAPANPAAGKVRLYSKTGDALAQRTSSGAETVFGAAQLAAIIMIIDGGGVTITTGVKGYVRVPFACTITAARALADQSGSIVVDVWKDTYANYPPVDADSITASAPITITTAVKSENTTLTGWTTSISAGDILGFNVDSVTTLQRVTIELAVTKA